MKIRRLGRYGDMEKVKNHINGILFGKSANIQRAGFLWNAVAGLINAGEAVFLLMVVSRTNGIEEAGILTIAFAVANLMLTIGKYGMRNYQVTDVSGRFAFDTYFTSRILTTGLMVGASAVYVLALGWLNHYTAYKAGVIFTVCLLYAVESLEDIFWGLYQRKGRLDVGAKIFAIRWTAALIVFAAGLFFFHDLFISSVISFAASFLFFVVLIHCSYGEMGGPNLKLNLCGVKELLGRCWPLCASAFAAYYVTNAPKYAIDANLSDEVQARYGFIAMPVFVIGLLNSFLYQPVLTDIALEWKEKRIGDLKRRLIKQTAIIVIITIACMVGAYILGIPILSLLYNTDLQSYRKELLVLLAGGGLLAMAGFFNVIMTVMRCQKKLMYGYLAMAITAFLFCNPVVRRYGVQGAVWIYVTLMLLLTGLFCFMIIRECKRVVVKLEEDD